MQPLSKRGNLRHHNTNHPKFKDIFPPKSAIHAKRVVELKSGLKAQQSLFVKPANSQKAATEASFRVNHLLAQHKKPFTDGELIKEVTLIIANTVFNDFKNKDDIKAALSNVPLGPKTVTRRVESLSQDVDQQVLRDLALREYFSVQSLDVTDTAQLAVFIRMVFQDSTTTDDFLTLLHLKDRTRGEDIFNEFKKYVHDNDIPIHKLVAITTDGAPAMRGVHLGFVALCRNDPAFPDFMSYHCIIHQQALVGKVLDFLHVMSLVVKLINSI